MLPRAAFEPASAVTGSSDDAFPADMVTCHSPTPNAAIPATEPTIPAT